LFRSTGEVRSGLVQEILTKIHSRKLFGSSSESPASLFVKLLGANVNLGNIAPEEVIPLETIRLGLRGDTFLHFLGIEKRKPIPPRHLKLIKSKAFEKFKRHILL